MLTQTWSFSFPPFKSSTFCFSSGHSSSRTLKCISGSHYSVLSPSPRAASEIDEGELSTVRYRPDGIDRLVQQTNFSKKELQILYRGFKNVSECFLYNHVQSDCTEFEHHRSTCMDIFYHMRECVCVRMYLYIYIYILISTGVSQWCCEWGDF